MHRKWVWIAPTLLTTCLAWAGPPVAQVRRVERPPAFEDFLSERPAAEPAVTAFIQREPTEGVPASQRTRVYLFYDNQNIYIIFQCHDSEPHKIRARLSKRDDFIQDDDFVSVRLDTFYDRRRAYQFTVNPLGIQSDSMHDESNAVFDPTFDTLWYSRGQITSWGYAVWMAIPLKSLRFSAAGRQTWGILLTRRTARYGEYAYWPEVSRKIAGFLTQAGELQGLEGISAGRNVQLIPYGSLLSSHFADFTQRKFVDKTANGDGGLDAKAVLRDNLALDVTINPDFSQVESDEPQVTVNQRFEVFFPEKRPFFLENANYFQTPIQVFFTRRIADPQFGVRLTGKQGPYAIGALVSDDQAPGQVSDPELAGRRAGVSVFRLNRDVASQTTIGAVFTERRFAGETNRVGGLDTRIKLPYQFFLQGQALVSYTRDAQGNSRAAPGFFAGLDHTGRHWTFQQSYTDFSPDFRTDLGYVPRVDIRKNVGYAAYFFRPERSSLMRWGPDAGYQVIWNHAGQRQDWFWRAGMVWEWRRQIYLWVGAPFAHERYLGQDFDRRSRVVQFRIATSKRFTFYTYDRIGRDIVYQPAAGLAPFQASSVGSENTITFRPIPRLRLDHTALLTRAKECRGRAAVFTNAIFRQKVNFQFNRELSLRTIFQYESTMPNFALSGLPRVKRFSGDVLLSYVLHPGTALYLGYNHRLENVDAGLGADPAGPPFRTSALFPTGRQFFAKISYLYRF